MEPLTPASADREKLSPANAPVTLNVKASKPVKFSTEIVADWLESENVKLAGTAASLFRNTVNANAEGTDPFTSKEKSEVD